MTSTGSIVNFESPSQCSENYAAKIAKQILHFVKSVPVISINTFFVLNEIFVESELIIGGKERTVPLAS